jgi:hypothetical protein
MSGRSFKIGDWVEVRSAEEILATLDESGAIDGLPFMPEMLEACGRRFKVRKRADKTCDTLYYGGNRRLFGTVHLEDSRCSGSAHGGCQAQCSLFWKEVWLKPADHRGTEQGATRAGLTPDDLLRLTRVGSADEKGTEVRYRCQATDLLKASTPLKWWDARQYLRDIASGNASLTDWIKAMVFRVYRFILVRTPGFSLQMRIYGWLHSMGLVRSYPFQEGTAKVTPREVLDLEPGEWVRIKAHKEILKTVNNRRRNRGLSFDPEMVHYCESIRRVRARVERIIDERTGTMVELSSDCIILEDVVCRAEFSHKRLFCPRALYPFWREIWLERVEAPRESDGGADLDHARDGD